MCHNSFVKKIEKIIIVVLIGIALIALLVSRFLYKDSLMVSVTNASNEVLLHFNIYEDNYYELKGEYGTFHIEVKDGKCRAIDVECPNQICVHTGWISIDNPVPIICLPNGLMVMIDEN